MTLQPTRPAPTAAETELLFKEAHQRRRRRRLAIAAITLVIAAVSTAVITLPGSSHKTPAPAASVPRPPAVALPETAPRIAWTDYHGDVHIGSLQSHQQRVVASAAGAQATVSMVASGGLLLWDTGGGTLYDKATNQVRSFTSTVMAYDTATGRTHTFASGAEVFNAIGSTDVYVGAADGRHLTRYALDGRLVEQLTLPAGWVLADAYGLGTSSPALAHGGILVQTQFAPQPTGTPPPARFAVWTPVNGDIHVLGQISGLVATWTDSSNSKSLVAWLPAPCGFTGDCPLNITDLSTGTTRQIRNPLGFGFDFRGAFSRDGRRLAAFAKTNPGSYNPQTRLALIDADTARLQLVPGATIDIGESLAWAQWLPGSEQLVVGGLSGQNGAGTWEANHFLVDGATRHSTPFSFLQDRDRDVNYSAVVLP